MMQGSRMSTGERWRLGHRPALDGLRGIAVLLVLAGHSTERLIHSPTIAGDTFGVGLFFVLSGFLITTLLLEERERDGRVSFGRFYARRAGRLLPALALMLAFMTGVGFADPKPITAVALYVANFYQTATMDETLGFTWSLSVEEQFYLAWPVLLLGALRWGLRREWMAVVAVAGAALSVVARDITDDGTIMGEFAAGRLPWTNADGLLLGAALACIMPLLPRRRPRPGLALLLVVALAAPCFLFKATDGMIAPTLAAFGGVVAVWLAARGAGTAGVLGARPLTLLGQRSYALYLWHVPMFLTLDMAGLGTRGVVLGGLILTWVLSALSWRFVEQPAQTWVRSRFRQRADSTAAATAEADTSAATAPRRNHPTWGKPADAEASPARHTEPGTAGA